MPRSLLIGRRRGGRSQIMFQECIPQHGTKATTPSGATESGSPTFSYTPPRPRLSKERDYFIDGATTPPHEEGTTARLQHLHSSPARAQKKPCGITRTGCEDSSHPAGCGLPL